MKTKQCKRTCLHCGGRVESKGIRNNKRRFKCVVCKKPFANVPLTEDEEKELQERRNKLHKSYKQVNTNLTLEELQQEQYNLRRKAQAYCILPEFDVKWQK